MTSYMLEDAQSEGSSNERNTIRNIVGLSYAGRSPDLTLWSQLSYPL